MISMMMLPLLACFLLVFIHVYFGAFIIRRGIIFIDLTLAQWAALGYVCGHLLDIHQSQLLFITAFLFTIIPSGILTFLKHLYEKTNLQEAVIGVLYITGSALAAGIISNVGMEGYHLQEMLAGHLLFIESMDLIMAMTVYVAIAFTLFKCHSLFLQLNSKKSDFLFYILFGLVVTSSVKMVGILLVFSYLVIPILVTYLFTQRLKTQIIYGWGVGSLCSVMGVILSFPLDIPMSYSIILSIT